MIRRLGPLFARARAVLRRAADLFPFTATGSLVLAGCAVALVRYGIRHIDLVLLVVGAVGLALGALALLVVVSTALGVWLSLRKRGTADPLRIECGYPARTGFSLPSLWYVPMVKVAWTWKEPEAVVRTARREGRVHEEVVPTRRGLYERVVRRVEVSDAFGLAKIAFPVREERAVRFVPSVGALKQMHVVRSIAGGEETSHPAGPPEGERADMRRYSAGDPIRFVLWKVFAKTRQLVVRTPERAISPVRQTVAYLVTGDGDEAAAGAARVAVESGALGSEWVLGADGCEQYAKTPSQALEVLARSARTPRAEGGAGLARFLAGATPGNAGRAVVFVPARPGPWLDRAVATARTRIVGAQAVSPVEFVVCTDGVARGAKTSWIARVAFRGQGATEGTPASDLAAVVSALGAARARVLVVDRAAGRVYTEGHRRALEAA